MYRSTYSVPSPYKLVLQFRFVGPTSSDNLALLESTTVPQLLAILSQGVEGNPRENHG